jgi:hypothetical protein
VTKSAGERNGVASTLMLAKSVLARRRRAAGSSTQTPSKENDAN